VASQSQPPGAKQWHLVIENVGVVVTGHHNAPGRVHRAEWRGSGLVGRPGRHAVAVPGSSANLSCRLYRTRPAI